MKFIRTVRRVDRLGRIVLPMELRKALDIGEKDELEIIADGEKITLQKCRSACIFCGRSKEIGIFRGKNLCMNCLRELQQISLDS